MSKLGHYLKAVRIRKSLSVERVQYRMEPSRAKIEKIEENPQAASAAVLTKYLKAIEITAEEYADFCHFVTLEYGPKAAKRWRESKSFRPVANVVRFESRAGIESQQKRKMYARRRQQGGL